MNLKTYTGFVLAATESVSLSASELLILSVTTDSVDIRLDGAKRTDKLGEEIVEPIAKLTADSMEVIRLQFSS